MKKLLVTTLAAVSLASGAFGQGAVTLDNSKSAGGPALGTAGTYYGGVFGMEVWMLNGTTIPSGINNVGSMIAYDNLTTLGFHKEATFTGLDNSSNPGVLPGSLAAADLKMADVNPKGSDVTLALVMWTGNSTSWVAARNALASGGVLGFTNPTADYTAQPIPTSPLLSGWNSDLVMTQLTAVPEPSSFALAGLGAAAMLIFRRRK